MVECLDGNPGLVYVKCSYGTHRVLLSATETSSRQYPFLLCGLYAQREVQYGLCLHS